MSDRGVRQGKLDRRIAWRTMSLGSSMFLLHLASSFLQFVLNSQLTRYGGELALADWGIVQSVAFFFLFPVFGLNGGAQPLIGYNIGARLFDRVIRVTKWAIICASCVTLFGFLLIQLASAPLAGLFSGEDRALLELSAHGLRCANAFLPVVGFQIIASGYFTSAGKPVKAMFLALSRQLLFLVPLAYLLPPLFDLDGLFMAVPIADGLSFIVTSIVFAMELCALGRMSRG